MDRLGSGVWWGEEGGEEVRGKEVKRCEEEVQKKKKVLLTEG